jgi:hypothetical protein
VNIFPGRRRRALELRVSERLLLTESSAMAFWVTTWSALIYLWLESMLHAPRLSMGFVVLYGLLARALLNGVVSRRLR